MEPSNAEYNKYLAQYERLIIGLANDCGPASEHEDLVAIGMMQLWLAMKNFDPARHTKFVTYLHHTVWGHMTNHMQRFCRKLPQDFGIVSNMWRNNSRDDGNSAVEKTDDLMSTLSQEDSEFLRQYYLEGKSAAEVAKATGTTRTKVYNKVARIKQALRAEVCV